MRRYVDRILDRLFATRDRIAADPRFLRFASSFPLLRPVARHQARSLFDLVSGFVYSQVLAACVRLDLFSLLSEGPRAPGELAPRLGLDDDATLRLLTAAAALGLAERRAGGRFGLGLHGAALLANPGIARMVEHHALFYEDLADPVALLRGTRGTTRLGAFWPYAGSEPGSSSGAADDASYTRLMAATQSFVAHQVLDAYPMARHRCLLDVGGGDGTFLRTAAARCPDLKLLLFDLPDVAAAAARRFADTGLNGRARAIGGDFRVDSLPCGADAISFVRVLHDHDDDTVRHLLKAARAAIEPGGRLVIAEPMAGQSGRVGEVYFPFYLLAMGRGRPRGADEIAEMVTAAGFRNARLVGTHLPIQASLLTASAP